MMTSESIGFDPCVICITELRQKLFKLKSISGMIPYNNGARFAKNHIHDFYSGSHSILEHDHLGDTYNIEHIVPVTVFRSRRNIQMHKIVQYSDEPIHDPHNFFATKKIINDVRKSHMYGDVLPSSTNTKMCINNTVSVVKDRAVADDLIQKDTNQHFAEVHVLDNFSAFPFDDKNSIICIDESKTVETKTVCDIANCIFSPPAINKGAIARCIFYMFLMYAFNPNQRPDTPTVNHNWLTNNGKTLPKWNDFFYTNLPTYYKWAITHEISPDEENRNNELINFCGYPNIFVGYVDISGTYVRSTNEILNELLFSSTYPHDHEKYTRIEFINQSKRTHPRYKVPDPLTIPDLSANYISPRFPILLSIPADTATLTATATSTEHDDIDWTTKRAEARATLALKRSSLARSVTPPVPSIVKTPLPQSILVPGIEVVKKDSITSGPTIVKMPLQRPVAAASRGPVVVLRDGTVLGSQKGTNTNVKKRSAEVFVPDGSSRPGTRIKTGGNYREKCKKYNDKINKLFHIIEHTSSPFSAS